MTSWDLARRLRAAIAAARGRVGGARTRQAEDLATRALLAVELGERRAARDDLGALATLLGDADLVGVADLIVEDGLA